MKLDNIRVFELREIFEDQLYLLLLRLKVLALGELHLVPDDLDTLFGVHCQVGAVDSWHIALLHLEKKSVSQKGNP